MKALFIILALGFFTKYCAPQPACDSEEVKLALHKEAIAGGNRLFQREGVTPFQISEYRSGHQLSFKNHRPAARYPNIQKCDCKAEAIVIDLAAPPNPAPPEGIVDYFVQLTKDGLILKIKGGS